MLLEAVWLKNGEEIAHTYPVWEVENLYDGSTLGTIRVHNGLGWYRWSDITDEEPDDFIVRIKRQRAMKNKDKKKIAKTGWMPFWWGSKFNKRLSSKRVRQQEKKEMSGEE